VKKEAHNSPWWDKECAILVNKRKWAYKKLSKCPSRENLLNYRKISSEVRKKLQKKKRNNFREFVSSLNLASGPVKFWNTIRKFKNSHYFKENNTINSNKQSDIDAYISKLAPTGVIPKMPKCEENEFCGYFKFALKLEELREIIETVKSDSSPGPDLINHYLLKLIPDEGLTKLLVIFEDILQGKYFPNMWRKYSIILLQKPSKNDFRPIALASCTLKLLERMVKKRLERFIESSNLIPDAQFGFRRGMSCEDCLAIINLEINKTYLSKVKMGTLFLDIKAAYDNVDPAILFNTINNLKIPLGYKKFIKNLLEFREIDIFESGNFQGQRSLYKGLPQGSVLSPLLFNLYIKDVIQVIPRNCKLIQFADDIAIFYQDSSLERIYDTLSFSFNNVNDWLAKMGLELSIPKTQFIVFHRSKNLIFPGSLKVIGGSIQRSDNAKYLGVILDSGLRWLDHINMLKVKSSKYLNILKWLSGRSWGIDPLQSISFINATIVAQLSWGAIWYINAAKSNLKKIDSIIASAYKIALGLPKNSSNMVCWKFSHQSSTL